MGLVALRNVPIAAVFCLPTLALGMEARLRERAARRAQRTAAAHPRRSQLGRRMLEIGAAVIIVIGAMIVLVPRGLGDGITANIDKRFPVQGVAALKDIDPDARVLADYGWGGYVIHELYQSGGRVFVDGRNDMYDQQVLEDYDSIKNADPDWEALADRLRRRGNAAEAGGDGHARSGRGCRLVRAVPRRERGPLPPQLPLTQLGCDRQHLQQLPALRKNIGAAV